jgi:uncharacterized protein YwgA
VSSIVELARLIDVCEQVKGRVKLQKIVHILQESGFSEFDEDYTYLHHGPYSSDLAREVEELVGSGYMDQVEEQVGDYTRYVYRSTPMLKEISEDHWDARKPGWRDLASSLNLKESQELEAISTIMFLRRRSFSGDRLKKRFEELKPHLQDRFTTCLSEAERMQKL